MSTTANYADRFGLVSSPAWVLWLRDGCGRWEGRKSSDDKEALWAEAMAYPSSRVRVLPMGRTPAA